MKKRLVQQIYTNLLEEGKFEEAHTVMAVWLDQINWENRAFDKGVFIGVAFTLGVTAIYMGSNSRKKQAL